MPVCASCGQERAEDANFCPNCGAPYEAAVPPREVRKTVTVVFCDVTDSTELGESTDPEALRALLARYFERMKAIIEAHGGSVEKFIGDAVMAVFGVPVAHEDDGLRACRAAVEMREALPELGIIGRIGVNTGEVVTGTEERLATGDAVNLAARLEQGAQPGEALIGKATVELVRAAVEVGEERQLELKGKSEPVAAYPLLAVTGELERRFATPMVGRARELHRLQDAFAQAAADRFCQLFTLLGSAGVGKSRLAAEFLRGLEGQVVRGRCLSYGEGITYWPVVEILKQLRTLPADDEALPLRSLLGETEQVASADEIAWGFRKLLEQEAQTEPLVVLLDDLHWAEETLLDLVEHVADLSRDAPILLLCMARAELLERRPTWGGGKWNATTVLLEPLDAPETETLLSELGGVQEDLRERIVQVAEGNPLFVEEMLALVRNSGDGKVDVPPTIQALLTARLDQLDHAERSVLERGSVEGRIFHRGSVVALSDGDGSIDQKLVALVRKELVRPDRTQLPGDDAYRFRHLLIRDAAYDALPKAVRAELHARFARWLAQHGEELVELDEILGYHLERVYLYRLDLGAVDGATKVLAQEAAKRLGSAGHKAFARGDAAAALNLISRAVALLPADDPARAALIPNARVVQGLSGDLDWADRVLNEAVAAATASNDQRLEAHALVQRAFLRLFRQPRVPAQELFEVANQAMSVFEAFDDELGAARASRLAAQAHYLERRAGASAEASARALAYAHGAEDRLEVREIVEWFCVALMLGPTPAAEVAGHCQDLLGIVEQDPILAPTVLSVFSNAEAMQGHMDRAAELLASWRAAVDEFGESIWLLPINFGFVVLADDPVASERELRPGYDALRRIGERSGFSSVTGLLARAVCAQGRYEEADRLCIESAQAALPNDIHAHILWRTTRAKVLAHTGQLQAAETAAREAVTFASGTDFLDSHGDALVDLAEVLTLANRTQEAATSLEQAVPLYEQKGNLLSARRTRAALDRMRETSATSL